MKKPIIGVIALVDEKKDSYWMLPGYLNGIMQAGGVPIVLPFAKEEAEIEQLLDLCDGILLTGGHDVNPAIYGEEKKETCGAFADERDALETKLIPMALKKKKSILGICRGIQLLNACLGGTLYQDLPTEFETDLTHVQKIPYHLPIHEVSILKETPLYELLAEETLPVNSYHHQAIKALAPQLKVMAQASDGLIEAVYMPEEKFVWAVQWHPEFSYHCNENSAKIFEAFIQSMTE